MTVFRNANAKTWRYDFWWQGHRYTGNTLQTERVDAQIVENDVKKQLRLKAAGLVVPDVATSPSVQDWAEVYLEHVLKHRKEIRRTDRIQDLLRVVLRFWGARPAPTVTGKWAALEGEPYHNLRLNDPIDDPMWLLKFEDWMNAKRVGTDKRRRPLSGQTKNQYRSTLSQMYRVALLPAFRKRSGVTMNPFLGIPRDRGHERTSTVSVDELRAWLTHASYHVRLAVAIAALAPKLRLGNILALRWGHNIDKQLQYITVHQHKSESATGRPLVVPIDAQLRRILEDARRRNPKSRYVVSYRQGKRVRGIRGGVQAAARDAGLRWGRFDEEGVTFHTIRHTMATMLAELGDLDGGAALSESVRMEVLGHERLETTQRYTHIRPQVERRALARLSKATPIADLVTAPWTRATRKRAVGKSVGTRDLSGAKTRGKTANSAKGRSKAKIAS